MTFIEHLEEFRKRLIVCIAAMLVGFGVSWYFSEELLRLLLYPLLPLLPQFHGELIYTGLAEPFMLYLKISLLAGAFLASPVIFYQIWSFISPGLRLQEKKYALPFILFSTIFFVGGALFGFLVVFPMAFKYFLSLTASFFSPKISIKEYFGFASRVLLAFGLVFEFPVVAVILARIGILDEVFLRKYRKYSIVVIFIAAAVLTPGPDPISQVCLALPLYILYELSIFLVKIFKKKPAAEANP
jgi:sec-independent protein translocase protein TatC